MTKLFGFLVINKPQGFTSHDCVNRIRKVFNIKQVGHGGTLDPSVTGVLPIALGDATRLLPYLEGGKSYRGIIQLGESTTTDDADGDLIEKIIWPELTKDVLNKKLDLFRGCIKQIPPRFSSVHFKGNRAYKLAREGIKFNLPAREITINKLSIIKWDQENGQLEFEISCSAGTYIRSLARDLGALLKCGGHLKKLHRTEALGFKINNAIKLPELKDLNTLSKPKILDPILFLNHLKQYKIKTKDEEKCWRCGQKLNISEKISPKEIEEDQNDVKNKKILVIETNGEIAGLAIEIKPSILQPKIVFNALG